MPFPVAFMSVRLRSKSRLRDVRRTRRLLVERLEGRHLLACSLEVTTTVDGGAGSLREAINCANSNGLDDVIFVPAGAYTLTGEADDDVNLGGDLDLTESDHSLTIRGVGADQTVIDAGGSDRAVDVGGHGAVLESLSIVGGFASSGGGILNRSKLTLNDVTVRDNTAEREGGGIHSFGELTLNRS